MKFPLYNIIIFILSIPFLSLYAKTLSQCVGSDLILRPEEYADDQEFFDFKILKVSDPKRNIATWPHGSLGERVKIIDEGYQNATVIIQHLQPSDAGHYKIHVTLKKSSKSLNHKFTVQIDESCTTESTVLSSQTDKMTKKMTTLTTIIGSETSQKPNNDNNSQDSNNNSQDANNSSHDANNNSQDANATEKQTLIVVNNIYDIVIAILVLLVLLVAIVIIVKYWKRWPCCKSCRERTPQGESGENIPLEE